jgi:[acyl-carrier-protein] S-malonyltransferase
VETACAEACAVGAVSPANYNAPGQLVISGTEAGVAKALELCKAAGGRAIPLAVSGPFHSPAMAPAGERLRLEFAKLEWKAPQAPVLANVDARPHGGPLEIQEKLVAQVSSSVRWTQTILEFKAQGFTRYIEAGPGKVLAGLVKKIDPTAMVVSVGDPAGLEQALAEFSK